MNRSKIIRISFTLSLFADAGALFYQSYQPLEPAARFVKACDGSGEKCVELPLKDE